MGGEGPIVRPVAKAHADLASLLHLVGQLITEREDDTKEQPDCGTNPTTAVEVPTGDEHTEAK
jgi:hypothetical protein